MWIQQLFRSLLWRQSLLINALHQLGPNPAAVVDGAYGLQAGAIDEDESIRLVHFSMQG
jgi:hypothetical protein